jgi:sugar (pentulose or hexulose) kinase
MFAAASEKRSMSFLGIDVGTGGTRALVIDETGRVIASATEAHKDFASPQIGWAEQDPDDWWRACGVAVRKVLAENQLRGDQIALWVYPDRCMARSFLTSAVSRYGLL